MQQTCQHCGYESPASDKFCRQCGTTLPVETEVSSATTRSYLKQEATPSATSVGSARLSPSFAGPIEGETERYYRPPQMPGSAPPSTAPIKSKLKSWRWIFLLLALLISATIGAVVTASIVGSRRPGPPPEERNRNRAQEEWQRRQRDQKRQIEQRIRDFENRVRDASNRRIDALRQAHEANERAADAGEALVQTGEKPLDLSQYEYPGVPVIHSIKIPGNEMTTMRTSQNFETVTQHYQKKIGNPTTLTNEEWEKMVLFQTNSVPSILVSVETDPGYPDQLKIVVMRSPFRTIKIDSPQNPR